MIQAILIDLDDTLLDNKMEQFLPAYFQRLGEYLSDRVDPGVMLGELLSGTQMMMENLDPTRSLERAFADRFYPALGFDEELLRSHLELFYREVFPGLQSLTTQRPEARGFVNRWKTEGINIAVATNPLFPALAVEERLRWAGFPDPQDLFSIVTSYERFHFTKPHPEYYAEILGRLGVSPQDAVMIGNDPPEDLVPAVALGMGAFHLGGMAEKGYSGGDFEAANNWIEHELSSTQRKNSRSPVAILARARGHLGALVSMLDNLDEPNWSKIPAAGEWSIGEIMCHLRDVECEVHIDRLGRILEDDVPHIVGEDTDAWAEIRAYKCQPGHEALETFIANRLELIEHMAALTPDDWERKARHTLLGPVKMSEVMAISNDHDIIHLAQLRQTLASVHS